MYLEGKPPPTSKISNIIPDDLIRSPTLWIAIAYDLGFIHCDPTWKQTPTFCAILRMLLMRSVALSCWTPNLFDKFSFA